MMAGGRLRVKIMTATTEGSAYDCLEASFLLMSQEQSAWRQDSNAPKIPMGRGCRCRGGGSRRGRGGPATSQRRRRVACAYAVWLDGG